MAKEPPHPPPPLIGYHLKHENEKPTNPHTKLKPTYPQTQKLTLI